MTPAILGVLVAALLRTPQVAAPFDSATVVMRGFHFASGDTLAINSADDVINPPELGLMERLMAPVKNGRYVLVPIGSKTRGHGTHTMAAAWREWFDPFVASLPAR